MVNVKDEKLAGKAGSGKITPGIRSCPGNQGCRDEQQGRCAQDVAQPEGSGMGSATGSGA